MNITAKIVNYFGSSKKTLYTYYTFSKKLS